jgi:hypothetical protein
VFLANIPKKKKNETKKVARNMPEDTAPELPERWV